MSNEKIAQGAHSDYYNDAIGTEPPVELIQTVSLVTRQPTLEFDEDQVPLTVPVKRLRGIFLNLLAFLIPCLPDSKNIVVIYHCPAIVINTLASFFPDVEWRVIVREAGPNRPGKVRYMTEQKALEEGSDGVILISLHHSAFISKQTYEKFGKPKHAMIQFPMHFRDPKTLFLDGTILCPVYSDHYSFDFYLVPNGKLILYDNDLLKAKAYSFHVDYRGRIYPTRYEVPGLDNCFDCSIETAICEMYIFGVRKIFPKNDNVTEMILSYSSNFRE